MNEAGPKTRQEVRKEVEDKHAREQRDREEGRGGRHGGGQGGYNDKGDRRGGGGRNDRRDGGGKQYQEKKQQGYQQKGKGEQPASPTKKGRGGGREEKKVEEPVEIVEIDDEVMGESLNANFDTYCSTIKQLGEVEDDEETKQLTPDQVKPDYDLFKELKTVNGKTGDQILASLLSRVFCEETAKVEAHLTNYLMHLHKDKLLSNANFNNGMSRMADILPDLALDLPAVHKYLFQYVIEPLRAANILDWSKINWVTPEDKSKAAEDDDEEYECGPDPFFKLLALILADHWKSSPGTLADFYKPWEKVVKEKHPKIEQDDLFTEIEEEIGADAAKAVVPLLNP